jgi:hypothetical protein
MLGGAASAKTASYTLVAADAGTAISMSSASATTITVNTALFAAGDTVQITNLGAGVCTITAGTATVNTSASLALAQYESGTLYFTSTSAAIFIKGAGSVSGLSSPNFTLLNAGGTALTGATTITVSFTAKDYLFVRIVGGSSGTTNAIFTMRLNADSGANYPQARWQAEGSSGGTYSLNTNFNGSATSFLIAQIGEVPDAFNSFSYISGAKASGIKTYQGLSDTTNVSFTSSYIGNGFYSDSADITSVSIISSAGNFNGGTIYVYGA